MTRVKRLPQDELYWWRVDELSRVKSGRPVFLEEALYVLTHSLSGMGAGRGRALDYPQAKGLIERKAADGWVRTERVWVGRGKDRRKLTVLRWGPVKRNALPVASRRAGS